MSAWTRNRVGERVSENSRELKYCNCFGAFDKAIIPLALVGYEIVSANSALRASLTFYQLTSNAR